MASLLQRGAEQAPGVTQVWPSDLAPLVARIFAADPEAARRMALAPRRMVHAMAIWFRYARSTGMAAEDMAAHIAGRDARDLLAEAMPHRSARLPAFLDRLGPRVRPAFVYARLNAILNGPGAAVLPTTGEILSDHLTAAELAVEAGYPVLEVARATEAGSTDIRALATVLAFLRACGLARDIEALPEGAGWWAVVRRVRADLGRGRAALPACPPPPGWEWVEAVAELRAVGRRMRLCVAGLDDGAAVHIRNLLLGRAVFLHRPGDEPILAALRCEGPGLWSLGEVVTVQNVPASFAPTLDFRQTLRAAGFTLLDAPVAEALGLVAQNAKPPPPRNRLAGQDRRFACT